MKNTHSYLTLFAFVIFTFLYMSPGKAQETTQKDIKKHKNRISLSCGVLSKTQSVSSGSSHPERSAFAWSHGMWGTGPIMLSYERAWSDRVTVTAGFILGYYKTEPNSISGYPDMKAISTGLNVTMRYQYNRNKLIHIYSLVGVANPIYFETYSIAVAPDTHKEGHDINVGIAMQLTPVGISIGRRLQAHAEGGWGYKGRLNLGVSYAL